MPALLIVGDTFRTPDLILVTEDGYENLTAFPYDLEIRS